MCVHLAGTVYKLPMTVKGVEFQFDCTKLTVYYESHGRVEFRELVKELYAVYKTRIWLQKVDASFALTPAQEIAAASQAFQTFPTVAAGNK